MSTENEILAALQHEARKPSRNAATLTHNIRATFPFLETQWDDKARQIIGALVAVNASRMHSTIWAALFQQLREASGASIKVYIFKQFANVCWTVPRTQGANAFRAFALEIRPLLSDIQIVTNTAFQRHFSSIVCYLTHFADEGLSLELYNTLYANLVGWKRVDALRAASNVIVELVLRVPHCPTVETLLARAKEDMDLFLYTILLDTVVAADTSEDHSQSRERIPFFCQEAARVMSCVLESVESNAKSIPPLISTYRRVKSFCKSWEPADGAAFVASIIKALNSDNVSKLLICPYLQFLQTSSCEWPASSDVVWKYTESTDPFVRADAFIALSTKALALDVSEKRLAIAELLDKLHIFLAENCSYTVVAVLKYLRVLLLSSDIPLPTQQLYLTRLLHVCSRYGKDLQGDAGAQLELLSLFAAASTLPEAAQKYIVRIFLVSSDRAVAAKAIEALLHISATCKLDDKTRAFHGFNTAQNNFDSFICTDHADNSVEPPSLLFSSQRGDILTALICERLSQWRLGEVNESVNRMIACDAVRRLCDCVTDENLSVTDSLHATLTLFSQLLVSQEEMSSEVSISLVRASAACVKLRDSSTASDLPLLSRLVQQTWSVLVDCAALLHPDFIPSAEATTLRFFRTDATPFHMHNLIVKCRDIALSNEVAFHSSVFYEIVECNALLLTECVAALADSPLFLCEATSNIEAVLRCCDAFFPCSPKQTLRFLTVLLDALVSFETASSETNPEIKRFALSFSKCCSSLVNHAITLNFQSYCPELCSFLLLCLQKGSQLSVGVFLELIANNWTFVADLASFCKSECICYGNSDEGSTVLSVLRLLRCLCWSSYRDEIVNAIPCSAIDDIAAASHKWRWFAEREECRHLILDLQRIYTQQTHNTENNLPSIINEQTPPSSFFERLEHVIDLWNVSDAPAQNTIREYLLHENTGCSLTILAAADNVYIPTAVAFVLSHQEEEFILELLLLVIRESTLENLPPLDFYVHNSVLGAADHLVKDVIQSYKWGWVTGPKTKQFLCDPTVKNSHTVLGHFLNHVGRSLVKNIVTDGSDKFSTGKMVSESLLLPHQLLSNAPYTRNTKFSLENFAFYSSAEEILLSNSDTALRLLNQAFAKQDNFADLSDPHVIFLFAKHISTVSASGFFLWDLSEWIALLRSWVSVALTTQPESEQWAWLQLSCWTLFYRVFEHLFSVAKHGHPSYPKENGTVLFEEMRRIYIQLSNSFLCCDAKSVDEVAFFVVRYALKNDVFFEIGGIFEEIFWCVARTCVDAAWLVVKGERCASLLDPEVVKFMCRMQGKLGLPLHMQRSAHTLFAVHLRKYGCSNSDLEVDAQRHVLWLSGSFGTRLYSLSAAKGGGRGGGQLAVAEHSAELNDHAVFRSAVLTDIFKVIHESLGGLAQASPSAVFDSLNVLRGVLHWTAISPTSSQAHGSTVDVEQAFEIIRGFISSCSPLSRAAPLQPATHCLRSLLNEFPLPRRVSAFTDEYALSVTTKILSTALASWLRRVSVLSAPPAYVPCTLAVYLPYLLRLDLPLYLTALGCVESLAAFTASAEVDAVYRVVLPRLTEDLVDVHWSAQVTSGWTQALIAVLGSIHGSGCGGTEQLARRVWEVVWRGASSPDVCHSQAARENVQAALKQLIGGLVPKSAQWELSRLVVLSASAPRPEPTAVAATPPDVREWDVQLPLRIVAALELSHWRSLLVETQTHFALHAARGLDADSSRSLLFEFEKAVESLLECVGGAITFTGEDQQCCLLRERVTMTLLSPTDAVLAALNRFEYSDWDRRRSVVLQLRAMAVSAAQVHPEPTTTSSPWTDVYFDVLFERATCIDEGLWASCAVAAVEASGGHLEWAIPALQSLVAASSTRRKRGLLRRVAEAAKLHDTQARVRAFFAGASDRLAASTTPVAVWKSELLVEVTFCFSASS